MRPYSSRILGKLSLNFYLRMRKDLLALCYRRVSHFSLPLSVSYRDGIT